MIIIVRNTKTGKVENKISDRAKYITILELNKFSICKKKKKQLCHQNCKCVND